VSRLPTTAPVEARVARIVLVIIFAFTAACSDNKVNVPGKVSALRPLPAGGSEVEITVTNPLDEPADVRCTVEAPGPGNAFNVIFHVEPSGERSISTNLPNLDADTAEDELEVSCQVEG
jgi:hypothetical protein